MLLFDFEAVACKFQWHQGVQPPAPNSSDAPLHTCNTPLCHSQQDLWEALLHRQSTNGAGHSVTYVHLQVQHQWLRTAAAAI